MSREVLEITGLSDFVQDRVDGVTMCDEHEDALSGVAAGRAGNYGVVIGVAELLSA